MSLFSSVKDGLLLCKLINDAIPETIDERVLNKGSNLSTFKMGENQSVAINSAKAIGCNVINIGSQDLIDGTVSPHFLHFLLTTLNNHSCAFNLAPLGARTHMADNQDRTFLQDQPCKPPRALSSA